jgi:hypothetical protein
MEKRTIVEVDGSKLHLVLGKSKHEWEKTYGELWDILFEEFLDGTMEINEDIWYWYINGRCYETFERVR